MIRLRRFDHLVLTVRDMAVTCAFYTRVLGMTEITFGEGRKALLFGRQKINLHPADAPFRPHAAAPVPGSADICLLAEPPMADILHHLRACRVALEEGPVRRTGASGPIFSVYIRDPDGNLLEISVPVEEAGE